MAVQILDIGICQKDFYFDVLIIVMMLNIATFFLRVYQKYNCLLRNHFADLEWKFHCCSNYFAN